MGDAAASDDDDALDNSLVFASGLAEFLHRVPLLSSMLESAASYRFDYRLRHSHYCRHHIAAPLCQRQQTDGTERHGTARCIPTYKLDDVIAYIKIKRVVILKLINIK